MGTYDMAEDIRVEVIMEPKGEIYLSWCSLGLVVGQGRKKALMPLALSSSLALAVNRVHSIAKSQEKKAPKSQMSGWSTTGSTLPCWGCSEP